MTLNQGWIYQEQVADNAAGATLLEYYTRRYTHSSPEQWRDRIQLGLVTLDDRTVTDCQTTLKRGQLLAYHRPPWVEPEVPFALSILYEDEELLILHKPAGLPVLPGGGFLENTLWGWLKRHYSCPPSPLHRLGRGTSGVMLLAKTETSKSKLSQDFRNGQIEKIYRALATGVDQPDTFTVSQAIGKIPYPTLGYLYAATKKGKPAISHCRVLRRGSANPFDETRTLNASLLEVTIPTGRPHQIRIHLAAAGYPLWGDPLYGIGGVPIQNLTSQDTIQDAVPGDCGYYLHAHQVKFVHPIQARELVVTAEPPTCLV